jgi:hypothetical protein
MYYTYTNKNLDAVFGTGANVFTAASTLKNEFSTTNDGKCTAYNSCTVYKTFYNIDVTYNGTSGTASNVNSSITVADGFCF